MVLVANAIVAGSLITDIVQDGTPQLPTWSRFRFKLKRYYRNR